MTNPLSLVEISPHAPISEQGHLVAPASGQTQGRYIIYRDGSISIFWAPHHPLSVSNPTRLLNETNFNWLLKFYYSEPLTRMPL